MAEPAVLFVNLRGVAAEDRRALFAARRLGYAVDLVAPSLPGHAAGLVREFRPADTEDHDEAVAAARRLARRAAYRGVLAWGDLGVEPAALIAADLGLPGPGPAAAHRARHKPAMKAADRLPGLVGRNTAVTTRADLEAALDRVGLPAVLKPASAAGSSGIFEIHDKASAYAAYDRLAGWLAHAPRSWRAGLILDEFLDGPEFSVEGWIHDGAVTIAGVTAKWTTEPYHLEYQHVHPALLADADRLAVSDGTRRVIGALGLDHCAFHLECKLTTRGFRLIEVAARAAGDFIASHLIPLATGIDFHAACIRVACGAPPGERPRDSLVAGARFVLADRPGRFAGLAGLDQVLAADAVEHVLPEIAVGTELRLPPDDYDLQRLAAVIVRAPTHAAVLDQLDEAARTVTPRITALVAPTRSPAPCTFCGAQASPI